MIIAFLALFLLPALPGGRPAFLTPALAVFAFGVAVLEVAAAMLVKVLNGTLTMICVVDVMLKARL